MKYIFLTTQYNNTTGGTKYDKMFMDRLCELGEDVVVISDKDFPENGDRHYYNRVYKENISQFADADFFVTNSRLYTRFSGVLQAIKKSNPKIKMIAFHHHFNFMTQKGLLRLIHKKLELEFLNSLDAVIYASGYIFELSKKYVKTFGFLVETITPEAEICASKRNGHNLLFVGNLEDRKGLPYLISAFAKVCQEDEDAYLTIVGSGNEDYEMLMKRKVEQCGISNRVLFTGRVSEEEKIKLLNNSDIFVFPSLLEGLGLAIREAMRYGLPVVAFDNSAMGYTIKNNYNGILVKNKDDKALAQSILTLLRDDSYRQKLSNGALESSEKFRTISSMYNKIDEVVGIFKELNNDNNKNTF